MEYAIPPSPNTDVVILPPFRPHRLLYRAHRDRPYTENIVMEIAVSGDWCLKAVELALRRLIARHESLRVGLLPLSDDLTQQVVPVDWFLSRFTILTSDSKHNVDATANEIRAFTRQPFKLTEPPLLRAAILASGGDGVLLIVANHVVMDGWSAAVLFRDFVALYGEVIGAGPARLPDVSNRYVEYSRRYEASSDHATAVAYWRHSLASPVPAMNLPVHGSSSYWHLEPARPLPSWRELAAAAMRDGISPARFLQALTVASLLPFADTVIEIGLVDANRADRRLRDVVGCIVEVLPVRVAAPEQCNLRDLAAGLSASLTEARACSVPFGAICTEVSAALDPLRSLPEYRVTINVLPPLAADPEPGVAGGTTFQPKPVNAVIEGNDGDDVGVDADLDYWFWPSSDRPTRCAIGGYASPANVMMLRRLGHTLVRLGSQLLGEPGRPARPIAEACWAEAVAAYPG